MANAKFKDRLRVVADRLGTRREAAEIAGVTLDALIRHLRGDNQPGFHSISALCEAAGISMHWLATGKGEMELADLDASLAYPLMGFAESKEAGWYKPQALKIKTTLDISDEDAFAAVVYGEGLAPEGLYPGFLCICSPKLKPVTGDIVHLRRKDDLCSLRLFVGEEKGWLLLKAYTDADKKGAQRAYEDKVKRSTIKEIAPVVFIKRKV